MNISLFNHADNLQTFKAGETIFQEGEPGHVMYGVVEGEVEISVHGRAVEVVEPEGIIGEMALIDPGQPRSAKVVAKTDCKLAPIDEKRFQFLVQQTPYFSLRVMRIMADRLRRIHDLIS